MNFIFTRFVLTSTFIFARDLHKGFTTLLLMLFSYITTFLIFPLYEDIINMSSYFFHNNSKNILISSNGLIVR